MTALAFGFVSKLISRRCAYLERSFLETSRHVFICNVPSKIDRSTYKLLVILSTFERTIIQRTRYRLVNRIPVYFPNIFISLRKVYRFATYVLEIRRISIIFGKFDIRFYVGRASTKFTITGRHEMISRNAVTSKICSPRILQLRHYINMMLTRLLRCT